MAVYYVRAVSPRAVAIQFDVPVATGPALTNPTNYLVRDQFGNSLTGFSVDPIGTSSIRAVTLRFLSDVFVSTQQYSVVINAAIVTAVGAQPYVGSPETFHWVALRKSFTVNLENSDKSPTNDPFISSGPSGLFFTPSRVTGSIGSDISVDRVDSCILLGDRYVVPTPQSFHYTRTWSSMGLYDPIRAGGPVTWCQSTLTDAPQGDMVISLTDGLAAYTDSNAVATLVEHLDHTRAPRIHNLYWKTFPATGSVPYRTADLSGGSLVVNNTITYPL